MGKLVVIVKLGNIIEFCQKCHRNEAKQIE